jgi:glyoxylase-like metal-dependent hydrolase (beta-lactamase superfamily II)
MATKLIFPGVHRLTLGAVNVFFIEEEAGPGLVLVDTGYAGSEQPILAAAQQLGRAPQDIRHLVLTHCHPDHAGSLAALKERTGAQAWMHPADAAVVRGQAAMVRSTTSPGLLNRVLYRLFIQHVPPFVPAASIEHEIADDAVLPLGGGLRVLHTPGHSAGHVALWLPRAGGLLFAGDACSHVGRLSLSIVYDDHAAGRRSLAKLAALNPPPAAICFGHGGELTGRGVAHFRQRWRAVD